MDDANILALINPPSSGQIHLPALSVDTQDSLQDVLSLDSSLSSFPSLVLPSQPSWISGPNSEPLTAQQPPMQAPKTDGEPSATLTEVNPESGPITGGARIWLKGINFPSIFPLFARFGTSVVPTVSRMGLRFGPYLQ
jgi:hypothetical protein